jgi:hypothetical protein
MIIVSQTLLGPRTRYISFANILIINYHRFDEKVQPLTTYNTARGN